jgi:hypothetical protein
MQTHIRRQHEGGLRGKIWARGEFALPGSVVEGIGRGMRALTLLHLFFLALTDFVAVCHLARW